MKLEEITVVRAHEQQICVQKKKMFCVRTAKIAIVKRGSMFCTVMEALKGLPYPRFEQNALVQATVNCSSIFNSYDVMEKSLIIFLGSWISAAHFYKIKFKASNTLFNIAEYVYHNKERIFCFLV